MLKTTLVLEDQSRQQMIKMWKWYELYHKNRCWKKCVILWYLNLRNFKWSDVREKLYWNNLTLHFSFRFATTTSVQTMGTGSFPGVKSGRSVRLTPHPLLVPWSKKGGAIPLLPLWAVRPVQSLSACTRVHFTFTFTFTSVQKKGQKSLASHVPSC